MSDQYIAPSGAKRSKQLPAYGLLPLAGLRAVAARFEKGAIKFGKNNWRAGLRDPDFVDQIYAHAFEHLLKHAAGDRSDDHGGAVAWAGIVLAEMNQIEKEKGE